MVPPPAPVVAVAEVRRLPGPMVGPPVPRAGAVPRLPAVLDGLTPAVSAALRRRFRTGVFWVHFSWIPELRRVTTCLLRLLIEEGLEEAVYARRVLAFLILPGVLHWVGVHRRPKPLDFLRACVAGDVDTAGLILGMGVACLDHDAENPRRPGVPADSHHLYLRRRRRCIEKLHKEGRIGTAARVVDTTSLDELPEAPVPLSTEETLALVGRLHPPRGLADELPDAVPAAEGATPFAFTVEDLRAVLPRLASGSAAGPSPWTFRLIRTLFHGRSEPTVAELSTLCDFLSFMANGRLPYGEWARSRVVLLAKPDGGHRPLGIGEVWSRLTGKLMLLHIDRALRAAEDHPFLPTQFGGGGISCGCEIAAGLTQRHFDADDGLLALQLDFRNAFNTVPRGEIWSGISGIFPGLRPWYRAMYGQPTELVDSSGATVGQSSTGCRQGDPLAPFLFCAAIQPFLRELQQRLDQLYPQAQDTRCGQVLSYMDDITILIHRPVLEAAIALVSDMCRNRGLLLNPAKSCIFGPSAHTLPEGLAFPVIRGVEHGWGAKVLGSPVGCGAFREAYCVDQAEAYSSSLRTLARMDLPPATAFAILKGAMNPRMSYLTACQGAVGAAKAVAFDQEVDRCILAIAMHVPDRPAPAVQAAPDRRGVCALVRSLPCEMGGLGILRHSWVQGPFLAQRLLGRINGFLAHHQPHLVASLGHRGAEEATIGALHPLWPDRAPAEDHAPEGIEDRDRDTRNQHYARSRDALVEHLTTHGESSHAVMFRSEGFAGSGKWLVPSGDLGANPRFALSADEYRLMFRQRLLIGLADDDGVALPPASRCLCRTRPLHSEEPYHWQDCWLSQYWRIARHNAIRDFCMSELVKRGGTDARLEPALQAVANAAGVTAPDPPRADFAIRMNGADSPLQFVDVTVTNPSQATLRPFGTVHAACEAAEARKRDRYVNTAEFRAGRLCFFSFDSTGRMGGNGYTRLKTWLPFNEELTALGYPHPVDILQGRIASLVVKYNARMLVSTLRRQQEAVRRATPA